MADGNSYLHPALARARAQMEEYKDRAKSRAVQHRDVLKEALFVAEVGGASYAVSRLAGAGGPEGRTILGVNVELLIGAALGGAGLLLIGRADALPAGSSEKTEEMAAHLLALGAGSIAAYTSRLGFEAGLANAKPPEEAPANGNQVSGAPPPVTCYYIPAPPAWAVAPGTPAMIPATIPMQAQPEPVQSVVVHERPPNVPLIVQESPVVGADEIESAVEILERMNRSR